MLITLTGPTGSGKSTLAQALVEKGVALIPSWTTRDLRPGEQGRGDMVQVSQDEMVVCSMLETADYDGHRYGTPLTETVKKALSGECHAVKVIEPNGLDQLRNTLANYPGAQLAHAYVDIDANTAKSRLLARCHGQPGDADMRRIHRAEKECRQWPHLLNWDVVVDNRAESADFSDLATKLLNGATATAKAEAEIGWPEGSTFTPSM